MVILIYRSEYESGIINLYDGHGVNKPIHQLEKLHAKPVTLVKVVTQQDVYMTHCL